MEFEAVDEGIIGKILIPEGTENVSVNTTIALLLEDGEDVSALESETSQVLDDVTSDRLSLQKKSLLKKIQILYRNQNQLI